MITALTRILTGRQRVTVSETERVLALHKGRFVGIFGPGQHWLPNVDRTLVIERFDLAMQNRFVSRQDRALFAAMPETAETHLLELQGQSGEIALLMREGALIHVCRGADERAVFWKDAGPWEILRVEIGPDRLVPAELHKLFERTEWPQTVQRVVVARGQVALVSIGARFALTLGEGTHFFWKQGLPITARLIDTRWQDHDVTGQELLTRDRVTIRVNIAARFRVTDPERAVESVDNFVEALHRALQAAFRRTLGARTLDQLLAEKVTVDAEPAEKVRTEMAAIGLEVGEITLKDVILPGEMREILNRVVAAEKEAEANIIRRREETAATRQLLNTAKVMAENPAMLRLKELEALEQIAGKVEKLTVHNGTAGLMNDLVRLGD